MGIIPSWMNQRGRYGTGTIMSNGRLMAGGSHTFSPYAVERMKARDVERAGQLDAMKFSSMSPIMRQRTMQREAADESGRRFDAQIGQGNMKIANDFNLGLKQTDNQLEGIKDTNATNKSIAERQADAQENVASTQASAQRDVASTQAGAQRDVAATQAGAQRDVATAQADAQKYVADTQADALIDSQVQQGKDKIAAINAEGEENRKTLQEGYKMSTGYRVPERFKNMSQEDYEKTRGIFADLGDKFSDSGSWDEKDINSILSTLRQQGITLSRDELIGLAQYESQRRKFAPTASGLGML